MATTTNLTGSKPPARSEDWAITRDRLAVLRRRHSEHAVSLHERHRNCVIAGEQGDRNPLLDRPERGEHIDWTNGLR